VEYLDRYALKSLLIDISEDDNNSVPCDLVGYRVVAIAFPAVVTTGNMTFQVDLGDGTWRTVTDEDGTNLQFTTIAAYQSEIAAAPRLDDVDIVGARFRVVSSSNQLADRQCYALLEAIGGQ
jgi:hypothetical protein